MFVSGSRGHATTKFGGLVGLRVKVTRFKLLQQAKGHTATNFYMASSCRQGPANRCNRMSISLPVSDVLMVKTPFLRTFFEVLTIFEADCLKIFQNSIKFHEDMHSFELHICVSMTFSFEHSSLELGVAKVTPFSQW